MSNDDRVVVAVGPGLWLLGELIYGACWLVAVTFALVMGAIGFAAAGLYFRTAAGWRRATR